MIASWLRLTTRSLCPRPLFPRPPQMIQVKWLACIILKHMQLHIGEKEILSHLHEDAVHRFNVTCARRLRVFRLLSTRASSGLLHASVSSYPLLLHVGKTLGVSRRCGQPSFLTGAEPHAREWGDDRCDLKEVCTACCDRTARLARTEVKVCVGQTPDLSLNGAAPIVLRYLGHDWTSV